MSKGYLLFGLAGLILTVGAPLAGNWLRSKPDQGCALDRAPIVPLYRVRIVDEGGHVHDFCCIRCAQFWLTERGRKPRAVEVTDEASGRSLDAATAYFVRSQVVTTPTTGNRVHVFRTRADADWHANQYGGRRLQGAERPFPNLSEVLADTP